MSAELDLPPEPRSGPRARRFVRDTLRRWRLESLSPDAELMVSELVTNAVLHTSSSITVTLTLPDGDLRIAVRDGSVRVPRSPRYSAEATTGRGLSIVNALASDCGVTQEAAGKTMWAVLPAPSEPAGQWMSG